ncbi:hypothetical protein C5Z25_03570 [Lactobacillus sp. CBA3605]|uniref:MMPL family transporter n=1 Tax=Lactobacillus sp. CBA3605 TaxID=2099788 RepID=UPI000CFC733D|nr:MMPL family transporter [Lactobacillus sp. CBA3605]AVK60886.1 hypothetical protein C5Z25_03570 [Lactobacillus sp. CBA3605]
MGKFFKMKFLYLGFWLLISLTSIAVLPNMATFLDSHQATTRNQTHTTKLVQLQNNWGRHLSSTKPVTMVFNNPNATLSQRQQASIQRRLAAIEQKADYYSVKQLRTSTTSSNDRQLLTAKDGSTILAVAAIDTRQTDLPIVAKQLAAAIQVAGLKTAVTSPELDTLNQHRTQQHQIRLILGLVFGSAFLLLALIFRSVLIPLINLLIQTVGLVVTTSMATNASQHWHLPITSNSILLVGLTGLLLSTGLTWTYMQVYLTTGRLATMPLRQTHQIWGLPLVTLAAMTLGLSWTPFLALASAWLITLTIVIMTLVALTLNEGFATLLLPAELHWPGTHAWPHWPKNAWGQLSRYGQRWPLSGILVTLLLLIFGVSLGHPLTDTNQITPTTGTRLVTAHFGPGAATKTTLYLATPTKLTSQTSLQAIDTLTTKLQQIPGVATVTSVTQPTGKRLTGYYVETQLKLINTNLDANRQTLKELQKDLTTNQAAITATAIDTQLTDLQTLQAKLAQLATLNDAIARHLTRLTADEVDPMTQPTLTEQLTMATDLITTITDLTTTIQADQTTLLATLDATAQQLTIIQQSLTHTTDQLKTVTNSITATNAYLTALKASQVGKLFYLTQPARQDPILKTSLATNMSQGAKITQLVITFKTAATDPASFAALKQVQQTVQAAQLASPLAHATATYSGEPEQQATNYQQLTTHAWEWALITLLIMAICLWLGCRSLVISGYLTTGLVLIIAASLGVTQFIYAHWLPTMSLPWLALGWSSLWLSLHWILVSLTLIDRRSWRRIATERTWPQHFYRCSHRVWPLTLLELSGLLPMLILSDTTLAATGLMTTLGIGLIQLGLPLILPGLLTWTVQPPQLNPKTWFHSTNA